MTKKGKVNQDFALKTFVINRWADAKDELTKQDPAFVRSVEIYATLLENQESCLPLRVLTPGQPLPPRWHRLLETTLAILQDVEHLNLTTSLITPSPGEKVAHYYFDVWVQIASNLCDKVKLLVTHCCRLYLSDIQKDKYHCQIDSRIVQGEISKLRHPLVHGTGGKGTVVKRAITEEQQGWEFYVAVGSEVIDFMLEYDSGEEHGLTSKDWYQLLARNTSVLLSNLGNVLNQLEQEIAEGRREIPQTCREFGTP